MGISLLVQGCSLLGIGNTVIALLASGSLLSMGDMVTVKTLNIGTPRPATVVVLNMKQFNFTMK